MISFKMNKVTLAITVLFFSRVGWSDNRVDVPVYVDEDNLGQNWQSLTIGSHSVSQAGMTPPVAIGNRSIAIGNNAKAGEDITKFRVGEAIAVGSEANASKEQSIAIGAHTSATGWGGIVIGGDDIREVHDKTFGNTTISNEFVRSTASGTGSVAIGARTLSEGELSVALGSATSATADVSTAIGAISKATDERAVAVGFNASATAKGAMAVGSESSALSESAVALGSNASAKKSSSIALGSNAIVSIGDNNVALGANSQDKAAKSVNSAVVRSSDGRFLTYQGFAASTPSSVISVGSQGGERQIVNVAAGDVAEHSTDAINGSQLYSVAQTLQNDINAARKEGFALRDSTGQEVKQSLGQAIKVSGDSNITTTAITNGDKGLKISLNNDLTVGDKAPGSIKVNGADGKEAVSLNGQDGTIKLTSTPAANGKSASATIAVNAGKGGLTDAAGTTKTRLTYTPDGKSPAEELATMNDGLSFEGDDGKVIHKKLNEKLTIKGGAGDNEDVTDSNIRVDANEKGDGLLVRMTRNLRDLASAVFGTENGPTTRIDNAGITITTPAAGGGQGNTVSLTGSGLNNGGNQITSVASGLNGTALADAGGDVLNNAANIGDLKNALRDSSATLVNTGFGLQADDGSKVNTSLGKHITVGGDGQNISTTVQNGSLTVRLADNIRLADDGSVSVGGTRMDKNGLTIKDGPSVTVNGIDAAGRVISGVKDGVNDQDAVNVSQLNREISQATAATTWALKTESGDEAVAVSSQTVEVRHGQNTRVSAISKDDKGNYSYEIDVTGIPVEYTDSQGNPLVNIGGRFYTQTEDAATGKLTMTPAEPARVRISSEQPLVLTNVAAGNVSPVSTDAVNGSQLASAARIAGGDNVVWKDGKAALAPDTFSELTTAGGGKTTVNGGVHETPDNVADAVNMLNREGTKYFKAASSGQAAKAEGRDSIAVGQGAVSRGQNSIAMGNGAEVTRQAAAGSVAIGSHARAGRANTGTYALNGQAVAGRTGSDTAVVSFGQPGQERQLQSVAPGVLSANSTDAVNGSQLHATNRQVAGNTQAINTLGNKFSQLSYRVEELNRDIRGVGASAAAMSGIPQAYLPGKSLMGLGVGGYGGESAIAIGVSRISDNGKVIMKLNAGQNTRGNFSVGAGVGWQW
ncbi:YadA-like family protein [Escherichia coli]|uniref:YadA-like family protein n=1 Tax=Escherichia coli TaxID=562 RepID=UPI001CC5F982|nr:YadA-like family protein [Escherichia coli]MDS1615102.1 YadA-like family protein [Escherichia coli]